MRQQLNFASVNARLIETREARRDSSDAEKENESKCFAGERISLMQGREEEGLARRHLRLARGDLVFGFDSGPRPSQFSTRLVWHSDNTRATRTRRAEHRGQRALSPSSLGSFP